MSEPTIEQLIDKLSKISSDMATKGFTAREYVEFAVDYRDTRSALFTRAKRAESSLAKWREIAKRMFEALDDLVIAYEDEPGFKQKIVDAYRALLNEESGE